ncbi:MAG: CheR family methyltransferase [Clostridia bacterium]|nr:protein-glutamate O-methyltransferase CheR [Clostridiaceae bacterium]
MFDISDKEFELLSEYIRKNFGIHLKKEKKGLLIGRLQNILIKNNIPNFSKYYEYLLSDKTGEAASVLANRITTNHTYFMREAAHMDYMKDHVLPYLKSTVEERDIRIWSAGCSTGEEPYTLAMVIDEFFGSDKLFWDTKILATDISDEVLNKAKKGIYGIEELKELPLGWKLNYFEPVGRDRFEIKPFLKDEVIFRKFNLMEERFFFKKPFHVIFCKNVMIYFEEQTAKKLVDKFFHWLEPGGYLFVGLSESLKRASSSLKYMEPGVYRKE